MGFGGGGGGGGSCNCPFGGNGGSGIVVIRYAGPPRGYGGTITMEGSNTVHTFLSDSLYIA
jgi:hypothetical protein